MKLSVHLVTWNGAKYVPYLFDSLRKQTYKDWRLVVVDNNSQDGMVELMKKELENFPIAHEMLENKTNVGFAGGHNLAFHRTSDEYFILLNQDMYLVPGCLETIVRFLDAHPEAAAVSPRLMKWNFGEAGTNLQASFTDQIDALGLKVFRSRRVIEQYAQHGWSEVSQKLLVAGPVQRVFGVSGAFPAFRRSAIVQVLLPNGTMLDESYHSYKEDVDLAYRLASAGFEAYILLDTISYHDRSAAGPKEKNDLAASANKKTQSEWVKYHSYKNHIMTLYKNEYWQNFILDLPWILWYELKKLIYFVLFDRKVLAGLQEVWRLRKDLKQKRNFIKQARQLSWQQMRALWKL
jgi:GT2 family glycosyltransferase